MSDLPPPGIYGPTGVDPNPPQPFDPPPAPEGYDSNPHEVLKQAILRMLK